MSLVNFLHFSNACWIGQTTLVLAGVQSWLLLCIPFIILCSDGDNKPYRTGITTANMLSSSETVKYNQLESVCLPLLRAYSNILLLPLCLEQDCTPSFTLRRATYCIRVIYLLTCHYHNNKQELLPCGCMLPRTCLVLADMHFCAGS